MMIHAFEDDWRHQGTTYRNALGLWLGLFLAHMPLFVCTYIRYCTYMYTVYSLYVGTISVGSATCDLID